MANASDPVRVLREQLGAERVLDQPEVRAAYAYDGTPLLRAMPLAVVRPQDVEQVQTVLRLANELGFGVVPRGSGTGLSGGAVPSKHSVVLLFPEWNRIEALDTANATVWVQPGVITAHLHATVEAAGWFYPPDPGSMRISTIGGNVAENAGGLRGLKYGVTKHYVLAIEGVLPTGEWFRAGSQCVKDVAGYNLTDLLVGSEGTLAVFTRILLRLIPKPPASEVLLAVFDRQVAAAEAVAAILERRIVPAMLEFLDRVTVRCVEDYAHVGLPQEAEALLLIELDGHPAQVQEEAELVEGICRACEASLLCRAASQEQAEALKTARRAAFSALARLKPTAILEDVTVPRSELPGMVGAIQEIAARYELTIGTFGHAGDGNLHPTILADARDPQEMARVERALEEIFEAAVRRSGTITGEHGVGLAKKPFLERLSPSGTLELMRRLRKAIDPNEVLNPGKIISLAPRCEHAPRT
ncbi:MAG: FAD-binding protein [Bacteroidetes bacterium]|nr:FAD-binding protein [Rhodothermia bacterium]MCS7155199.1 FAD-binding protein [Bacteroidota bacterium]MCX7907784.1 FAD-binding protein [Bacteroidota bacterium]MDW8138603.1 FAD-linked oxidase C-terminal domain-containing protein [Bacteroidota bacterium]MDW8284811.1 FAD-linked oxidase C-terminal domain-containing protein [Bacteroidota bacterium]